MLRSRVIGKLFAYATTVGEENSSALAGCIPSTSLASAADDCMELPTREKVFKGGSGHVDTVGVRGSNPLSRTIPKRPRRFVQKCLCAAGKLRYESTAYPIISLVI